MRAESLYHKSQKQKGKLQWILQTPAVVTWLSASPRLLSFNIAIILLTNLPLKSSFSDIIYILAHDIRVADALICDWSLIGLSLLVTGVSKETGCDSERNGYLKQQLRPIISIRYKFLVKLHHLYHPSPGAFVVLLDDELFW